MKYLYIALSLLLVSGYGLKGVETEPSEKQASRKILDMFLHISLRKEFLAKEDLEYIQTLFNLSEKDIAHSDLAQLESRRARILSSNLGRSYIQSNNLSECVNSLAERPSWTFSSVSEYQDFEKNKNSRKELKDSLTREVCNVVDGKLGEYCSALKTYLAVSGKDLSECNESQEKKFIVELMVAKKACEELKAKRESNR